MSTPVIIIAIADYRRDAELHLRELGDELDAIEHSLLSARKAGICQYITIAAATPAKIVAAFDQADGPVVGFHFSGHNGGYHLLLNSEEQIEDKHLANFLSRQPHLQFVFLNACATFAHAQALHRAGINAVITTAQRIEDSLAREVATHFYQQLGKGKALAHAFQYFQSQIDLKGGSGKMRGLAVDDENGLPTYPWQLSYREGAAAVTSLWSLSRAAGNPLFGLPPIPEHYDLPHKPFRYLERYEQQHARIFFGRAREIHQLYELLTESSLPPILLFYGQSGVGKSSLVAAGLLPRLEQAYTLVYRPRDPQYGLVSDLAKALHCEEADDFGVAWRELEEKTGQPLLVLLDQVEECFTRAQLPGNELIQLYIKLKEVFSQPDNRPKGKLILTYRKEFHPDISELLKAQSLAYSELYLQRMDEEGIINAVTGISQDPILQKHYKLRVEEGLPSIIAHDLIRDASGSVAPVLQVLLSKLWDRCSDQAGEPYFSEKEYFRVHQSGILLADFLQERMLAVQQAYPQADQSGLLLDLLYFFTTDRATANQHTDREVLQRYSDRKDLVRKLLQALANNYLLLPITDQTEAQWRLAHDTLAPLVRARFQQSDGLGQQASRILENIPSADHSQHELNAAQLQILDQGRAGMRSWTPSEKDLIERSRKSVFRQARMKRWLIMALVGAGVGLVFFLIYLYQSETHKNKLLEARLLVNQAATLSRSDPTQAIKLYQQSLIHQFDPAIEDRMYELMAQFPSYQLIWADTSLSFDAAAFSPDGKHLVTAQSDEGLWVQVKRWQQQAQQYLLADSLVGASLLLRDIATNDEGTVVAGGSNNRIYRWNRLGNFDGEYGTLDDIYALALHPDGQRSAVAYQSGIVQLDLNNRQRDTLLNTSQVAALAYTEDGQYLLQGDRVGRLQLLTTATGLQTTVWEHQTEASISALQYHAPKKRVAVGTSEGTIHLFAWSPENVQEITNLSYDGQEVKEIVFDPQGKWLVAGYGNGDIRVWSLERYGLYRPLLGHRNGILALHMSEDKLHSLAADGRLLQWNLHDESAVPLLTANYGTFSSLETDPLGQNLILGGNDYSVYLFNLKSQTGKSAYAEHTSRISSAIFSADGHSVLSGDRDGKLHVWDIASGQTIKKQEEQHSSAILSLAQIDDRWVSADQNGELVLWSKDLQQAEAFYTGDIAIDAMVSVPQSGKLVAVGATSQLLMWQPPEQTLLGKDEHTQTVIIDVVYDSQNNALFSVGSDAILYRWSTEGALLETYTWPGSKKATALAQHPEGLLAMATEDGDIGFYNIAGNRYYVLRYGTTIDDLSFSPDGSFLYGSSRDASGSGVLLRWHTPKERLLNN